MTRVLIVDDKEENVYYLSALLSANGCQVDSARHGAEALTKARHTPPDLVISDLLMPVMDGYTLLRHWKSDARLKSRPFIVYTATYTAPEDERLAMDLGADAFILKPSEPEDFLARLQAVRAAPSALPAAEVGQPVDEAGLLRQYSEALIRKLEEKTLELEDANRRLREDIEAREVAETALRESEQRFRQLAESLEDVFWLSASDREEILYVSPAYETVWGRSRESLYARPSEWIEAVHAEDREQLIHSLADYASGRWEQSYRVVHPGGEVRWVRSRAYPVRDAGGQVFRVAGISRDVTQVRNLEEQVRLAQRMEAVGRLAGGVAHDFNNLLTAILGPAELLMMDLPVGDPMRQDLDEIRSAAERAAGLTRQLLAFSRQQIMEPQIVDLNALIADLDRLLRRVIGEDVELRVRPGTGIGAVRADPGQIEQVIMNLAVNSRDAMPTGGSLTIETSNAELDDSYAGRHYTVTPGSYVMVAVSDTGSGMDPKTQARMFEPFFTTKPKGKGTGLGLATVYGIVKQSGGYIWAYSEVGRGTTFKVYLPRVDEVPAVRATPRGHPSVAGTETLLIVEDDALVQAATRKILEAFGYRVLAAGGGPEALALAAAYADAIDLVVTDVVMPEMSGREMADRLRAIRPESRVLYLSGYTDETIVHHGVLEPGMHFLQKPFTPEALARKVRLVLDG